jgi:beta-lactamase superfamily II metal-dependent hydrolase
MDPFFRIEMLPARHGDCLWIEYGQGDTTQRVLIDGGPVSTFPFISKRLNVVPQGERHFELVVLTHVDADHVEGLVRLFAETPLPFDVDQVWFNGWGQMKQFHGTLGALQGEFLSTLLVRRAPAAWSVDAKPWVVEDSGPLPHWELPGGMKLTLLSPNRTKLQKMAKAWEKAVKKAGIEPGDLDAAWEKLGDKKQLIPKKGLLGGPPNIDALLKKQFMEDEAPPNGSSIAFLAEFKGKSALFLADAHPGVVTASLKRLCAERGTKPLKVDAVKISHHGSKANTDDALLKLIDSPQFLISTNGDQFKHPDKPCIARILKQAKPQWLYFNYRSAFTKPWLTAAAQAKYRYKAVARPDAEVSLTIAL